jgi:hypothetical protein
MTTLLYRAIATVRTWLGLNDPAEDRLHPSHGWLLPPSGAREGQLELALSPVPEPTAPSRRR